MTAREHMPDIDSEIIPDARAEAAEAGCEIVSPWKRMRARAWRHRGFMFGAVVLGAVILVSLLAPLLAPRDPYAQDLVRRLTDPAWYAGGSWEHVMGTDDLGRDYFSRLIYGGRVSLIIGFTTMIISGIIGVTLGVSAGYFGGRVDTAITFLTTVRLSMPVVLVALAVIGMAGSSLGIIVSVLGFLLWDRFAIILRTTTRQIREMEYVTAARAQGCSALRVIWSEILPNIMPSIIVVATLEMANAILLEAALSFLGLGVQPPTPSWGLMISEARKFMFIKGWLMGIPGVALFLLILAINLLGDGLRDVSAPDGKQ